MKILKKVSRIVLAFILITASNLHAQNGGEPISPGNKPVLGGSIIGPSLMNCDVAATFTFSGGIQTWCNDIKWNVRFPDGSSRQYTGESINIASGLTEGALAIFVYAKSCNNPYEYSGGLSVSVGTFVSTPSSLSGSNFLCNGSSSSYTASYVQEATDYIFTVPSGWKINGLSKTTVETSSRTVTITAPTSGRGSAQIRVKAKRRGVCGDKNSPDRIKTISYGTQYPVISASATTVGTNSYVTLTASGTNLSNFSWQIPNGWTAGSGLNGSHIILRTGTTPGNFHVEVSAQSCGVTVGQFVNINVIGGGGGGFYETAEDSEEVMNSAALDEGDVSIYPNPANDWLNLMVPAGSSKLASIKLIQVNSGKQVLDQKIDENSSINLSNVEDGNYILDMITTEGKRIQKRILVSH